MHTRGYLNHLWSSGNLGSQMKSLTGCGKSDYTPGPKVRRHVAWKRPAVIAGKLLNLG
ncbi:predicted protein [Plenodomus lingam JN3]|uniref:Uncharacterized protein n=1 Tax=Leptosphaeria maculans (strain JN3 / isolate v23.1.3 / race Av1-4-5-6-7-8) TaxID=985895 RepID=E5A610_LEPMJ|nr:predicted protein [Plenodomus lingam JN3]CBX99055.1 predicted protein [Plenodomus lingam JN3]